MKPEHPELWQRCVYSALGASSNVPSIIPSHSQMNRLPENMQHTNVWRRSGPFGKSTFTLAKMKKRRESSPNFLRQMPIWNFTLSWIEHEITAILKFWRNCWRFWAVREYRHWPWDWFTAEYTNRFCKPCKGLSRRWASTIRIQEHFKRPRTKLSRWGSDSNTTYQSGQLTTLQANTIGQRDGICPTKEIPWIKAFDWRIMNGSSAFYFHETSCLSLPLYQLMPVISNSTLDSRLIFYDCFVRSSLCGWPLRSSTRAYASPEWKFGILWSLNSVSFWGINPHFPWMFSTPFVIRASVSNR